MPIAIAYDEVNLRGDKMKKASKVQTKTAPATKANLKVAVKKAASTVSPKISSNHNETFLTR